MIYEVQQSSDLTFRVWDYDRVGPDGKPRELHADRAVQVITFDGVHPRPAPWQDLADATPDAALLVDCPHYRLHRFSAGETPVEHHYTSFAAVTLLDGEAEVAGRSGSCTVSSGGSFLVPAGRPFTVAGSPTRQASYLIASVA